MITAKQLKDTYPHKQMRMYIEDLYPGATLAQRAAHLGALVKKFLFNFAIDPHGGFGDKDEVPKDINTAFIWGDTPEGQKFWGCIHDYEPVEEVLPPPRDNPWVIDGFEELVGKKAKVKLPKAAPKKVVGWWH